MTSFTSFDTAHHLCGIGIRAHDHLLFHNATLSLMFWLQMWCNARATLPSTASPLRQRLKVLASTWTPPHFDRQRSLATVIALRHWSLFDSELYKSSGTYRANPAEFAEPQWADGTNHAPDTNIFITGGLQMSSQREKPSHVLERNIDALLQRESAHNHVAPEHALDAMEQKKREHEAGAPWRLGSSRKTSALLLSEVRDE
jgi:hypothetical protein